MFSLKMAMQKYRYFGFIKYYNNACIINEIENLKNVDLPKNQEGSTLLMIAASQGNLEIFEYLLEKGANIFALNNKMNNCLIEAVKYNHLHIAQRIMLIKNSKELDKSEPLYQACKNNNLNMVKLLIKNGANPNCHQINSKILLIACVRHSSIDIIRYLLQQNAYMDTRSFNNWTPLTFATSEKKTEIVKLLKAYGASTHFRGPRRACACQIAINLGYDEIYTFLHASGSWSTFETTVACRYNKDLTFLVKHGNINPKMFTKQSMLDFAQREDLWIKQPKKDNQTIKLINLIYSRWKPEKHFLVSKQLNNCIECLLLINNRQRNHSLFLPQEIYHIIFTFLENKDFR